ncbi:MAG TPA: pirin family protein [Candidatus Binatia bacterium]|jgi:redox-sensitive bicupin YhaK (pirin superfamily)|nr:pirin family protein [Candidatus Binatia bacterium]
MIEVRRSSERGHVEHGWLDTRHTFSFGHYVDPEHMGFRVLRVINEDMIAPGEGFGKHFHDDMEIITYVTAGRLAHQDNAGGGGTLGRGDVQHMSAGRGVIHSEFNASKEEPVRLLQIWILPATSGIDPSYAQKTFNDAAKRGKLLLIVSGDGRDGSLMMRQDADLYAALLGDGETAGLPLRPGRHAWVQMVAGAASLNGVALSAGDGAAVSEEGMLRIEAKGDAEVLVFDLP